MLVSTAISAFITAKEGQNLAKNTIIWYQQQLETFAAALNHDPAVIDITPETISAYLAAQRHHVGAHTLYARWNSLNIFFNWLSQRHGHPSPMLHVPKPRVPKSIKNYVEFNEYDRLRNSIPRNSWFDYRDVALIDTLYWCGLRLGECAGLDVEHLNTSQRTIRVVEAKGGKDRLVPAHPQLPGVILEYLMHRPPWSGPELWLAWNVRTREIKGRIAGEGIRQMLIRRCKQAEIRYMHPHLWRHGTAMMLLNNGAGLDAVAAVLGHSDTKITESTYAHWRIRELQSHYEHAVRNVQNG